MAENGVDPREVVDEHIKKLEDRSEGKLEGLAARLTGGFWNKLKDLFYLIFAIQWADIGTSWETALTNAAKDMIERHVPDPEKDVAELVKKMQAAAYDPIQGLKELQTWVDAIPGLGSLLHLGFLFLAGTGVMKANLGAAWELGTQTTNAALRPSVLPMDIAIEAFYKDPTKEAEIKDIWDRMGLKDEFQALIKIATTMPLDSEASRDAFLRELITEDQLDSILKSHHLSDADAKVIKGLYEIIPPVTDIITMAVREVFTPDIVQRFGQMEDLPPEFVSWAKQKGLSEFWASAYWAAHWMLPSIGQGFEMLHRRVIDDSDLDLLLRALDVMPFWREKLKDISYRPLTRVDVRRMHRIGVLEEEGVFDAYLDVGYSEENARKMTEFTVAFNQEAERELTKTDIIALYKKFAIERDAAKEMLIAIAFPEDTAELLMVRADLEIYASYKKEQIGYIRNAYIAGKITMGEAESRLGELNLPATETNNLMTSWELARMSKVKELTLDNLKAFFAAKVITEGELKVELGEIGYNVEDIGRFVALFRKAGTE